MLRTVQHGKLTNILFANRIVKIPPTARNQTHCARLLPSFAWETLKWAFPPGCLPSKVCWHADASPPSFSLPHSLRHLLCNQSRTLHQHDLLHREAVRPMSVSIKALKKEKAETKQHNLENRPGVSGIKFADMLMRPLLFSHFGAC